MYLRDVLIIKIKKETRNCRIEKKAKLISDRIEKKRQM